ncbi:helix-turn-helix transcriptional regulator [Spirillospora sp. NPDC048911]|uniref:helix-turn-helix transcriptional regulator n=1 Tax=Spirillospora sp. NPDC048911 TaxID=3364527 RepID=UPI003719CE3A
MTQPRATLNGARKERRTELAAFLRSRRGRITPEDVGMAPGLRRRTPGLRREEVAQLAGVGVTWYTWLEQGRPINASPQVLDAVARTLRLDTAEREYLYLLADVPEPGTADPGAGLPEQVREVLDALDPTPACVANGACDVLAWNRAYAAIFPGTVNAPAAERNTMWTAFASPPCCGPIADLEAEAPQHVAVFRHRYSRHLDEPRWKDLVRRLKEASPLFAQLWDTCDVALPGPRIKVFRHVAVGEMAMHGTSFDVSGSPENRLVVYTPSDDESRERLGWLLANPEAAEAARCH